MTTTNENHDGDGQFITLRSIDTRITTTIRREHHVSFTFTFEAVFRSYLLEDSMPLPDPFEEERVNDASGKITVGVSADSLDKPDDPEMQDILEAALQPHWILSEENRRWLLHRAMEEAREYLRAQKVHVCISLRFGVLVEENRYVHAEDVGVSVASPAAGSLVPAIDASIASLKEYKMGCDRGVAESCCSICLEEFPGRDGEVSGRGRLLCMPCNHVFHGDCIEKWLNISHYCPLCRYQMPTD